MPQPMPHHTETATPMPVPGNPTFTEAWALIESAKRMAAPLESGPLDDAENREALCDALRLNGRLWTILRTELAEQAASGAAPHRDSMLRLCDFVDTNTAEALNDPTPEMAAQLIDVNRVVAEGLLAPMEFAIAS